ncbi:MAG: hypothetical protein NC432_00170, partial [Roseburia sp.]|nr:hypothetical protein [Roseburia sp.]
PDPRLRRPLLYPAELRTQSCNTHSDQQWIFYRISPLLSTSFFENTAFEKAFEKAISAPK